jgi:hypothetical protein
MKIPMIATFCLGALFGAAILIMRLGNPTHVKAQSCNNGTLQGIWGFNYNGLAGGLPISGAGHTTADGSGNATGGDTVSVNGVILRRTYSGTYNVNADCTGTTSYQDSLGNVFHQDFVVMNNSNSLAIIQADTGVVLSFLAQRQ